MKLCKDCKWCEPQSVLPGGRIDWGDGVCKSPRNQGAPDVITGEPTLLFGTARILREIDTRCGKKAKWFSPRKEK
jgi:hypothetical protein